MTDYFIYNHGGSGNHGCEALVRTTLKLFGADNHIELWSESPQQDLRYGLDVQTNVHPATGPVSKTGISFWDAYLTLKTKKDYIKMDVLPYLGPLRKLQSGQVELSVGGDIYCYEDYRKFIALHRKIAQKGCKSVLLGCSLEEKLFDDPEFIADMKQYTHISARESMTYEMLRKAGLTNIGLAPDAAFTLETERLPLPDGFVEGNTIGINLSPLVVRKETADGMVMENFVRLVQYILENTDCSVALIPHVVWQGSDDRTVLKELYQKIGRPDRVVLIGDHNCMQLKGFIARCRFFVGARTHATIAAYSSGVPTLVLGYSVKSRGIAKDLFGTDEHYVIPVQTLDHPEAMTTAFCRLWAQEQEIRTRLHKVMPRYINDVQKIKETLSNVFNR